MHHIVDHIIQVVDVNQFPLVFFKTVEGVREKLLGDVEVLVILEDLTSFFDVDDPSDDVV